MKIAIHQPNLIEIERKFKCNQCRIIKPVSDFPIIKTRGTRGFQGICKKCKAEWMRKDRIKNPYKYRAIDLKSNYGLTPTQYLAIFKEQNGVCAICYKQETSKRGWLHVDHHHTTGEVRGLLCGNCNTGIGKLGEDIDVLQSAIQYLRRVQG